MNNIKYLVEGNNLSIAFTSKSSAYDYTISLVRGDTQFYFQPVIYEKYEDHAFYKFSCSLADFATFLQEQDKYENVALSDENNMDSANDEEENDLEARSYKFTMIAQYLKYNKNSDIVKHVKKNVKLTKKKWSLSNLKHVNNE
ncbi:MAG: hypothetical protein L0L10_08800 [Tetragenococcus sp.]|nr:hypothetical protein [Tetragenococcus sp.]